ncbi:restriction endonuclease [Moraxellaceae bacterium AER2_44_116]|nr:restriction endonuclease subunit S [Moraxellaceae bacterium]TQC98902.1 restriction endonuclease [Moraxellaceae bacterium AER2_44_116]
MSQFNNQRTDNLKIFTLNFSDINGRLDPLYYYSVNNLEIVNKTIYPIKKLCQVIDMQRGRFGHRPRNEPKLYGGEYPFIQTGDIVRASQSNGKITYSQTLNELGLKTSRLFDKPVVVITIAANIGDTAILDYPACFPDSLIGMTPKNNELTLQYINLYFKFIKSYLEDLAPQSAQKNINYQQLSPVPIVVPPLEIQDKAVELYEKALHESQQQQQQAQALLASIDTYLLTELGITLPEQDNSLEKRMFRVSFQQITGERFDAPIQMSQFSLHSTKYPMKRLTQSFIFNPKTIIDTKICSFIPMEKISDESGSITSVAETIEPSTSLGYTQFQDNDLLWARITPCMQNGKSAVATGLINGVGLGSTEYLIFRALHENNIHYLHAILRLCYLRRSAMLYFGGATGHQRVSPIFFKRMKIPLPPIQKQNEIAEHIQAIRTQAKQLQTQAEQLLANAKAHIEQMILGQ